MQLINSSSFHINHDRALSSYLPDKEMDRPSQKPRPKIAILSGFVPSKMWQGVSRIQMLDHLVNKACYAHLWGYDYIFNMTYGFVETKKERFWLEYGAWHRAPNLRDRIRDYDWMLYGDIDFVIKDMSRPLESFLKQFQLYNKNPSVLLPTEGRPSFSPSSFAVLIKNDRFGRRVLDNWVAFGKGICKNGNFPDFTKDQYRWQDCDQPGLWYGLMKTHMEFFPTLNETFPLCNETTGLLDNAKNGYQSKINSYFRGVNAKLGNFGQDLFQVPNDQPIIWSTVRSEGAALGIWHHRPNSGKMLPWAFGVHTKKPPQQWPGSMSIELDLCKNVHGCYANYSTAGELQIGCNGIRYFPVEEHP